MSKSYVTLEQNVCKVCCQEYDTGALLMDKRMQDKFEQHTTTGWGMCPEHTKVIEDGYVILIGASGEGDGQTMRPEDADRTGVVLYLKKEVAEKVFNIDIEDVAFVDAEVVKLLKDKLED